MFFDKLIILKKKNIVYNFFSENSPLSRSAVIRKATTRLQHEFSKQILCGLEYYTRYARLQKQI